MEERKIERTKDRNKLTKRRNEQTDTKKKKKKKREREKTER